MLHTGRASGVRDPVEVLGELFGYASFRHGQRRVIDAVLAGRDCVAVMPTGSGKTVTFQVPARCLGGTTVVVSPLISLMADQVAGAVSHGLTALRAGGCTTAAERDEQFRVLCADPPELVYAAPEGLSGRLGRTLSKLDVRLLAVDEAHCVDRWGGTFRPDYLRLVALREALGRPPCLAVTASASPATVALIAETLAMNDPVLLRMSTVRPNLTLRALVTSGPREIDDTVCRRVLHSRGSGIVYVRSRDAAEAVAARLRRAGRAAESYHAGMATDERAAVQRRFLADETRVVVATVAFGMGIDKPDVRWVVHRGLPESVDAYYQEVGRAGRDGAAADCLLVWSYADLGVHRALARSLRGDVRDRAVLDSDAMVQLAGGRVCRHAAVAAWYGERIDPCGGTCDVCMPSLTAPDGSFGRP